MSLTDNLVAHWTFQETSGNAADSVGSNTLTANGSPGTAAGKVGNGRTLASASSQFFSIADNAALSSGDIDLTIACWVNFSSVSGIQAIVSKYTGTGNLREYQLIRNGTAVQFQVSATGTATTTTEGASNFGAVSTGVWYFVVCWHDAVNNAIGIQVNGTANTAAHTLGMADLGSNFQVGARGDGSQLLDATIDEVSVWKRILTSPEKTLLYNGGAGLLFPWSEGQPARKRMGGVAFAGYQPGGGITRF